MADKAEAKLFKDQKTAASDEHKAKISVRCENISFNIPLSFFLMLLCCFMAKFLTATHESAAEFDAVRGVCERVSVRIYEVHRCPMIIKFHCRGSTLWNASHCT